MTRASSGRYALFKLHDGRAADLYRDHQTFFTTLKNMNKNIWHFFVMIHGIL